MRFVSTRGQASPVRFDRAILDGLAPDGGLYVPERFPLFDPDSLGPIESFPDFASLVLKPFLEGGELVGQRSELCARAFDFPLRLDYPREGTGILELFHGPTAAFKDFGARFLAISLERSSAAGEGPGPITVLVATSGDTGGAVAAAFHRRPGMRVAILYPKGGVAPRQEQQLTCWDHNVRAFAVRGSFDDCQRVAKAAFRTATIRETARLTSANSINIGRLLPQSAYYAAASIWYRRATGATPGFVVPSGNVGNAVGAFWAKRMGFPIRRIAMATNANRAIADWFLDGEWRPRPSVRTLANAMDVGDPSNMERLFHLYPKREDLLRDALARAVGDDTIRATIARGPERWGRVFCPHTATAVHLRERLGDPHWIIVATAHPAKFETVVEPLLGRPVEAPPQLAELLSRPTHSIEIDPRLDDLAPFLVAKATDDGAWAPEEA